MITQFKDEYRWLSNFESVQIEFEGKVYASVEHAYQAAKSLDEDWRAFCASDVSAGKVKRKSKVIIYRPDWEKIKVSIMKDLLTKKFSTEPFKSKLLSTGDTSIIEKNTWGDMFWGVDIRTGIGENYLGKLIMGIRVSLKFEAVVLE